MPIDMETRIQAIEKDQAEFRQIARELRDLGVRHANAIEKLVRLEERHAEAREAIGRAFTVLEKHEDELAQVRVALPPLQETRKWVVTCMTTIIGAVILALLGLVIVKP